MAITILDHYNLAQAERIRSVFQASYQEEARLLQLENFPPLHRTSLQIQNATSLFLGYLLNADLIAVLEIEFDGENKLNIASFVVVPRMFRNGVGSVLLEHLLAQYVGYFVTVSTAVKNLPAIGLYSKCGFIIQSNWDTPCGLPMVTLSKNLSSI